MDSFFGAALRLREQGVDYEFLVQFVLDDCLDAAFYSKTLYHLVQAGEKRNFRDVLTGKL